MIKILNINDCFLEKPLTYSKSSKKAYNKSTKPKNHIFDNKVWLNNKYIKIN